MALDAEFAPTQRARLPHTRDPAARGGNDASPLPRGRRLRPLVRAAAAAALVLAVAACSSLRLGYNNADTLALYTLDRYFDLDDAQEQLARERVRALLGWHRRTQLADYAQVLDAAQRRLDASPATPLTAADVLDLQGELNARLMTVGRKAAPDLALLARSLSDAQMAHFTDKLAAENAKLRKEREQAARRGNGSAEVLNAERIRRSLERARDWLGPLTREQEDLVREAALRRPDGEQRWLEERERRQRALVAVLERIRAGQLAPEAGAALLNDFFDELAAPSAAERHAAVQTAREANARLIAQLLNRATLEQRTALLKRLRGYTEDFTVLAADGARS
ncbi:MAG: DUF6279 family lipoprotein [Burkholderiaceae bacterium]|nr:DUF6279 family lipoprotein [Burkholderiaceae bacterium]